MKVFLDTNVLIDAFTERDTTYKSSQKILRYVAAGVITGYITAKQVTDFYYCVRKYSESELQRKRLIKIMLDIFEILPTMKSDIRYCLSYPIEDLEDALIDEMCNEHCIDYLITHNKKDFKDAKSVVFTPEEALEIIGIDEGVNNFL